MTVAVLAFVETAAVFFGTGLGVALLVVGTFTLGRSVVAARRKRFTNARRPELYAAAFTRAGNADPEWESFVSGLSNRERTVLRDVLDSLLRTLRGSERYRLQELGRELGIDAEAKRALRDGDAHERRRALTWLVLLTEPMAPAVLRRTCTSSDDARAGAARLLYACGHPDARHEATAMLLRDDDETLTAFGLDTLYQLHRGDSTLLVRRAGREYDEWRPSLLLQVLSALNHTSQARRHAPLGWLYALAESEYPEVRAAVTTVFGAYGWREDVRSSVPVDRLCADEEPAVRRAAYEMLAAWGTAGALDRLAAAAEAESNDRARLTAVRSLDSEGELDRLAESNEAVSDAVRWVRAERVATGRTRATERAS